MRNTFVSLPVLRYIVDIHKVMTILVKILSYELRLNRLVCFRRSVTLYTFATFNFKNKSENE